MTRLQMITGLLLFAFILPSLVFAQGGKLTYEEYQAELLQWSVRKQQAEQRVDELVASNDDLRAELDALNLQTGQVWQQVYSYMGLAPADLRGFADELDAIATDLDQFDEMDPEDVYQNRQQLRGVKERLEGITENRASALSRYQEIIDDLVVRAETQEMRAPEPQEGVYYTVIRGDHLWRIASKREHYGDGMKWMRIYSVNRDQIRDPDLIYPKQVFSIPMEIEAGQVLVKKGQNLSSIAESIYNDPFKWRELYEANRDLLDDPTKIYPEMILSVPGR